jgi:general stress protein YciG
VVRRGYINFKAGKGVAILAKAVKGKMTVDQAGRKGGKTTLKRYGPEFYQKIGKKGGRKVKSLIEKGKRAVR